MKTTARILARVYGVWRVDPAWTVKGGVATGFRSPQLREITLVGRKSVVAVIFMVTQIWIRKLH